MSEVEAIIHGLNADRITPTDRTICARLKEVSGVPEDLARAAIDEAVATGRAYRTFHKTRGNELVLGALDCPLILWNFDQMIAPVHVRDFADFARRDDTKDGDGDIGSGMGRYGAAKKYLRCRPDHQHMGLGWACAVVQAALDRRIVAYSKDKRVVLGAEDDKTMRAFLRKPPLGIDNFISTAEELRDIIQTLLPNDRYSVDLSKLKGLILEKTGMRLEETALGHTRLKALLLNCASDLVMMRGHPLVVRGLFPALFDKL